MIPNPAEINVATMDICYFFPKYCIPFASTNPTQNRGWRIMRNLTIGINGSYARRTSFSCPISTFEGRHTYH